MADDKKTVRSRQDELDEFWDISALIPPKKKTVPRPHAAVTLTEISDGEKSASVEASDRTRLTAIPPQPTKKEPEPTGQEESTVITRYIPPHTPESSKQAPRPEDEYEPSNAMLHRVRIFNWKTTYQYYEDFCRHATALHARRGEPCVPVAFFSYVPQYSQMNRGQLNWYLWWRENVRRGEIFPTDYSYILLYVYELINLSDTIDVRVGQQQLCLLRRAFRATYPRLGHLLNEWICDYSLIHHLPPPALEDLREVEDCTLKEFYVPATDASSRFAAALMAFASNYSYAKSKFAVGENRPLYDRHMLGALSACLEDGGEVGARMASARLEESKLIRDAYTGALCSHRIKRRIEIEYCSFARSHELRILVTDIMKYTENRLRAYLGVKSRLGLYALPQSFRDCVDRYLRAALPRRERMEKSAVRQEYEALYDVPRVEMSLAHAAEIEQSSWKTTERLIAAFDEEEFPGGQSVREAQTPLPETAEQMPAVAVEAAPIQPFTMSSTSENALLSQENSSETEHFLSELSEMREFFNYALSNDANAQREYARRYGTMIDSIADRINEIAVEILEDIILEEGDGGYTVIEDYRYMFESDV